ncbi:MAG TPA: hypothetical protein ENH41_01160 [Candidatus Omnitrophica bacterium]|nr:hypothetical protein [Candidatus Omnitrophota bacterium]
MMKKITFVIGISLFFIYGCSDMGIYAKEGRFYCGMPFGQSSSSMELRKNIPLEFGLVEVGMTKKEVRDSLDEPARISVLNKRAKDGKNCQVWYYKAVYSYEHLLDIKNVYIYFDDFRVINPPD